MRIGVSRPLDGDADGTLANCTEDSAAKDALDRLYARCRDRVLIEWPHTFARKFATLTLADDGTDEAWEDEWDFAYEYPADCMKARRFVSDNGWGYYHWGSVEWNWPFSVQDEWRFVVRVHDGAKVILTDVDEEDADLEYTEQVTDLDRWTEPAASALAWLLASEIALPLAVDPTKARMAYQMYMEEIWRAAAHQANERVEGPEEDSMFVSARRGR